MYQRDALAPSNDAGFHAPVHIAAQKNSPQHLRANAVSTDGKNSAETRS